MVEEEEIIEGVQISELKEQYESKLAELNSKIESLTTDLVKTRELNNKLWERQTTGFDYTEREEPKSYEELVDDLFRVASKDAVAQMQKIYGKEFVNDNY